MTSTSASESSHGTTAPPAAPRTSTSTSSSSSSLPTAPQRARFSTDDIEEARSLLETTYDGRQFRARRGADRFAFRFASAGDDRLSLQTGTFLGHLQGTIPWSRDYVVSWFRSGSVTIDHPGGQLTSVGSRPFLTPTETSYSFSMTPHRHGIVHIAAAFLEEVAAETHGRHPQRIVFDYAAVPSDEALEAWRQALGAATPVVVGDTTPADVRLAAQTDIARALLDLFPWRAVDVPDAVRTERMRRLRQAAEYVHSYADQAITSADIATAAGMHTRTLQQLMNEHLGSSPTLYLRHVRLDRARQDLLAARPGEVLVGDIARRWGFGNLGRFSASYAARYGEQPRETLAR